MFYNILRLRTLCWLIVFFAYLEPTLIAQSVLHDVDRFSIYSRMPNHQLCRMLFSSDSRLRFGVTDAEFKAIKAILEATAVELPKPSEVNLTSKSELLKTLDVFYKEVEVRERELSIALHRSISPEMFDELLGMYLQYFGYEAVINSVIADRLKISPEKIQKIKDVVDEFRVRKSVFFVEVAKNQQGFNRNVEATRPFLSLRSDAVNSAIEKELSEPQRRSLAELVKYRIKLSNGDEFSYPTFGW